MKFILFIWPLAILPILWFAATWLSKRNNQGRACIHNVALYFAPMLFGFSFLLGFIGRIEEADQLFWGSLISVGVWLLGTVIEGQIKDYERQQYLRSKEKEDNNQN